MITFFVEECNPLTPDFYDNYIADMQFHRLTCPCKRSGTLSIHGCYTRFLKIPEGKCPFRICRVICSSCGHTHAILPSNIVPYSQISLPEQTAVIRAFEDGLSPEPVMQADPMIDESDCRRIISRYVRRWQQRLRSERIPLSDHHVLIHDCFKAFSRQFMQIHCTFNILFIDTT